VRAELLKIRSMPTPRWTAIAMLVFFVGGIAAAVAWGTGDDAGILDIAIGIPGLISSLVLGSWLAGVEFGQNTLRRVFSADPRRARLVLAKLAVLMMVIVCATLALMILGGLIYGLAGAGHEQEVTVSDVLTITGAWLVQYVAYAATAFSLTLLTRSMAGGMTLSFVFFFILDGLISFIPKVGDFTISIALADVDSRDRRGHIRFDLDPLARSRGRDPGRLAGRLGRGGTDPHPGVRGQVGRPGGVLHFVRPEADGTRATGCCP
jgi:hypothetical protein